MPKRSRPPILFDSDELATNDEVTRFLRCRGPAPPAAGERDATAVAPVHYPANVLGRHSPPPGRDVSLTSGAPALGLPGRDGSSAVSEAVANYLRFARLLFERNRLWLETVLRSDFHAHPRVCARVLTALHARARYLYVFARGVIHEECRHATVAHREAFFDEIGRHPCDSAQIVALDLARPDDA